MSNPISSLALLNREYLPVRAKILEIAGSLDRIQRAEGEAQADARWGQLQQAIDLLRGQESNRAEQVQLLLSRPYEAKWKETLGVEH